jgi:hypothetical protein
MQSAEMSVSGAITITCIHVLKHVVASETFREGAISQILLIKKFIPSNTALKYCTSAVICIFHCWYSLKYFWKPQSSIVCVLQSSSNFHSALKVTAH